MPIPEQPVRYQCPKCEAIFMQKSFLDKHLPTHCPTSQSCKVCNKTFANVYRLQRHMISHDESTDLRKFKCPECGKAFKFKHHLKEHIRIHSGEKPFECPNCHKRFSHSGSYSSHMTSKKCWVAGPKAHTTERVNHMEPTVTYSKPLISKGAFTPPVHMLTSMAQGPFPRVPYLHFDPKGSMPFFTPPPAFVPYSYSMIRHSSPMNPLISLQGKTDCIPSHHSISPSHGSTAQISPDVNSNTQLFSMHKPSVKDSPVIKREPESKEEPSSTDSASAPKERTFKDSKPGDDTEKKTTSDAEDVKPDIKMEEQEKEKIPCHFCSEVFNSAVDQHQHERYLCKANKELLNRSSLSDSSRNSPCSSISDASHRGTPNGSYSAPDTDHEDDSESKKFRMRTHISEEQLAVLKSHYKENPRPRKFELIRIGKEIGKEKRVVQVWFQNMRARDRRQGKHVPYVPSMARFKHSDNSSWKEHSPSHSSYIPVVPEHNQSTWEENGCSIHQQARGTAFGSYSSSIPLKSSSLNMSGKLDNGTEGSKKEGRLQSSAIYKYLQQEGMLPRHFFGNYLPHPPTSVFQPFLQATHDGASTDRAMADATLNLATLAEVSLSQRAAMMENSLKSKRLRKKSWRQMEAEEVQMDLDDSLLDDDNPLKKKRRSWKGHKIDAEEGMYACDQCAKVFSKQSSLARHKYEHSGARPFTCEICGKAFKHKHHLTEHRRLHSGEKPFECKKCGKRFSHSGSYSQHMNHRYKYCKPLREDGFSSS
nr:LOW QUALITY PROTEIN: zinc finger protein 1-like [Crassostrea gigas]